MRRAAVALLPLALFAAALGTNAPRAAAAAAPGSPAASAATAPAALAAPVIEGRWLRPAATTQAAQPLWGHADGLRVGLAHANRGPRGLLRVYAPYLDQPAERVINFIAVEPIPAGQKHRGLSELERSARDGVRGKRFWSVDDPADRAPRPSDHPARGEIVTIDGVERLRVFVQVEPFDNGARVYVRMTFRADRPREVALAAFAHEDSKPLEHCILTATMGNYARLRRLHLAGDEIVTSLKLWPDYRGDGFTPHAKFPLSRLARTPQGHAIVTATPDEPDPAAAIYAPGTRKHWHYTGKVATQSWRVEQPDPALQAYLNGRFAYWNSKAPIPGGVSFENFELVSPFRQGEEFIFAVEPEIVTPQKR